MTGPTRRGRQSAAEARDRLRAVDAIDASGDDLFDDDDPPAGTATATDTAPPNQSVPPVTSTALPPATDVPVVGATSAAQLRSVPVQQPVQVVATAENDVDGLDEVDLVALNNDSLRPAGIEIPAALLDRMRRMTARGRGNSDVQLTEIFLRAFETAHPQLDEIIASQAEPTTVDSSLFGTRRTRLKRESGPIGRLQIRPTRREFRALQLLARQRRITLTALTKIVLTWYIDSQAKVVGEQTR